MKVLIWDNFPLKNIGGPMGYLYNVHQWLIDNPHKEIEFLSDVIASSSSSGSHCNDYLFDSCSKKEGTQSLIESIKKRSFLFRLLSPVIRLTRGFRDYCIRIQRGNDVFSRGFSRGLNEIPSSIDLNKYDYIHFHNVQTFMQFCNRHHEFKGKTILTTHCPCPWTYEMLDLYNPPFKRYFRRLGIKNECKAYNSCSYIMLPCEEAKEPYLKDVLIKKAFMSREDSFFFVPTSILDLKTTVLSSHSLRNWGICESSFVVTFLGRHCSIKGYDILKSVAARLLDKCPNLYFVCAGNGAIEPYSHPRWIELGFINYSDEIHAQSDLYIVANRETYFDMGTLEVLRAGAHLVLSNTGGNKYFKNLPEEETIGLEYFDIEDIEGLCATVERMIHQKLANEKDYHRIGLLNRDLYLKYFTPEKYVKSYLDKVEALSV